jgi:hypothetical protein
MGDDLDACRRRIKRHMALYVGGMGARGRNFYNDYTRLLGYEDAAAKIQDLFLAGRHAEAADAVPDAYVDDVALVGPKARIAERLAPWRAAAAAGQVATMILRGASVEAARFIAGEGAVITPVRHGRAKTHDCPVERGILLPPPLRGREKRESFNRTTVSLTRP